MTEANLQPSKENKTRETVYLEHWCSRAGHIKSRIAHLKVAIDGRFLLGQHVH